MGNTTIQVPGNKLDREIYHPIQAVSVFIIPCLVPHPSQPNSKQNSLCGALYAEGCICYHSTVLNASFIVLRKQLSVKS